MEEATTGKSEGRTATCQTPGCGQTATLQCPTCVRMKLGGGRSFFCSQECFRGYWRVHKAIHTLNGDSQYNPWPNYAYTGKLRPHPVVSPTTRSAVPASIERPDYADDPEGRPAGELELRSSTAIRVLDDEQIDGMRVTGRLGREVLDVALNALRVGVTTEEIDRLVHEACIDRECYPSPLNYYCFPKSCCTSVNEVICHGIPDQRPLQDGDICNVDVTVYHRGFHGDLNETVCVGNVDDDGKNLVRVAYECLARAIDIVKPGTKYRDVGAVIQRHAQIHGFSVVRSYCGHGIHRLFHTAPNVPHYAKNKAVGIMKAGHTFTIEPMISEGTWRDEIWPDNWTVVTQDGKRSAQFEHTLLVTESGCDVLTRRHNRDGQPFFMD